MRKILLLVILHALVSSGNAQSSFVIRGKIKGLKNDTTLYLVLNQFEDTLGRFVTHGDIFFYRGELPSDCPEWASIRMAGLGKWPTFFLSPGKQKIKGQLDIWQEAIVFGSDESDVYYEFKASRKALHAQLDSCRGNQTMKNSTEKEAIEQKINEIRLELNKGLKKFISENPNSVYAAWLLANLREFEMVDMEELYRGFSNKVKQTHFGIEVKRQIRKLGLMQKIKPGEIIPEFALKAKSDSEIYLPTFVTKSKLTLIDFWASWCKPCKEVLPELKKTYHAFKDKGFNIISISNDKNKEEWIKALKRDGAPWINTRYIEGKENPFDIFDVRSIPAFVLVDQHGKLLAFNCLASIIPGFGFKNGLKDNQDIYDTVAEIMERFEKEQ